MVKVCYVVGALALLMSGLMAAQGPPTFEVASVKANHEGPAAFGFVSNQPGRFLVTHQSLRSLIEAAYDLAFDSPLLVNAPKWVDDERFDINATMPAGAPQSQQMPMLRTLLAEIPDYQSLMLPVLRLASDGTEHAFRATIETLGRDFALTPDERAELLPSRTQPIFDNRVGWAKTYLLKAGLLEAPRRGYFRITARGNATLKTPPDRLNTAYLRKSFQEFRDFSAGVGADDGAAHATHAAPDGHLKTDVETPEESVASAYQTLREAVESDLLARLKGGTAAFFERVVVELLVAMGYGGSLQDAGKAIGRTGDEGIDGIIKEDRLGLDVVYVQAKRWKDTVVGRPEVQKFAGALQGQRARKGVFITTATFSADARSFVENIDAKIVLIDGPLLTGFMFEHNVGVARSAVYEVKKLDADFFEEE